MEITLALVVISIAAVISLLMIGYGICEKEGDYIGIGLVSIIVVMVATGVRGGSIQDTEEHITLTKACIEKGGEVKEVFHKKICLL